MVKKALSLATAFGAAALLTGCLTAPVMPPMGMIYNDYQAPLDYTQEESPVGTKSGMAETTSILGCVAWGDASIKTAASNGGLTEVTGADYEYFNVLGVYQKYTTVVHGN